MVTLFLLSSSDPPMAVWASLPNVLRMSFEELAVRASGAWGLRSDFGMIGGGAFQSLGFRV